MTDQADLDNRYLAKVAVAVAATILSAAIIASFGLLLSVSSRLTVIETTVNATVEERRNQVDDLRRADGDLQRRIGAVESSVFGRERGE